MRAFLEASGQLGEDLLAVDWASTPLGDPDEWPPALRNSVRILLTSRFSMWMAWGPELTFFCNEAYRRDTLGKKYPWALGKPAAEVWSEIWPEIGPRIDRVTSTGEATWDESLMLFLERSGYVEETYHTFSYSPLVDSNQISGMLCVVKEDTEQVIATRRMATLRDLGTRVSDLDEAGTLRSACERLADNPWSLPFTLVYLFDDEARTARRAGATGFGGTHPAAPSVLVVDDPDPAWPAIAEARRTVAEHLTEWELPQEVVDEVVLMTSELVTNAFVHGRPPIDLRLRRTGSELVVEVRDRAVYRPRRRRADDDDESGRGLQIVSVLADRWGSRATGTGKSVWFSVVLDKSQP